MILDLEERIQVAYKKLKQMVYYEKHPLSLRRRLAEFDSGDDFHERLAAFVAVVQSDAPHETNEFLGWVNSIRYEVVPKAVDRERHDDRLGGFVSNYTSAPFHQVSRVNYLFDGPVELHLLSVLWLMTEGPYYDSKLSDHCMGSRLHEYVGQDRDHSGYLFRKYHDLYAKWRDTGIQRARDLLEKDGTSVCLIGLDVQEYYYRIELDWDLLRQQIKRREPTNPIEAIFMEESLFGGKLFRCIEEICRGYRRALAPLLEITHPDLPSAATCLPIGLSASPVIANWYLKVLDDVILEKVRPSYYGRYVDDILMVIPFQGPPESADPVRDLMEQILVSPGVIVADRNEGSEERFELSSRPGLFLQKRKCTIQYFDAEHSIAGLEKFQKQIEENASDFGLLPVDESDSPLAQVAYDLLYDGPANKFRNVKAISANRWALAVYISKQTQLYLTTDGDFEADPWSELFKFFKGSNAITFWDLWERVVGLFVVAGDLDSAARFKEEIRKEIFKVQSTKAFDEEGRSKGNVAGFLRESLIRHLEACFEISFAILGDEYDFGAARMWRKSNLIRHHLVSDPLANYTDFQGNLSKPVELGRLAISSSKAERSPRFVHFDECLNYVSSDFSDPDFGDLISGANTIYEKFHGDAHPDVESSTARRVAKKKKS